MKLDNLRPLPLVDGRAPRVALLVYNDFSVDTRVLKTASSYAAAGAQVRVVAFGTFEGMEPGLTVLDGGIEVERLPLVELDHTLPRLGATARRVVARARGAVGALRSSTRRPTPASTAAPTAGDPHVTGASPSGTTQADGLLPSAAPTRPGASAARPAGAKAFLVRQWARMHYTLRLGSFQVRAARSLRQWRPDLVHANDADTLLPAWLAGRALGAPYLFDAHEIWTARVKTGSRPVARRWEAWVEKRLAPRASGVTTVSGSIVDWMHRELRLATAPTLVRNVPVGPAPVVADPEATGRLRELAGLGSESRVVAYCGAITINRGIEQTLDALELLDGSTHLVLLGRGSQAYRSVLDARVAAAGLQDRVHFVGIVPSDEVPATLRDADASVIFSRPVTLNQRFSLPNKLFESIHAGLPVAASDLPDIASVVSSTGAGQVFDIDDARTTADAIAEVIAHADRYRAASAAAARTLTWQNEADGLLRLAVAALDASAAGSRARS